MPTDDITIYYSVEPQTSEIARVASEQQDEIAAILQKPLVPRSNTYVRNRWNPAKSRSIAEAGSYHRFWTSFPVISRLFSALDPISEYDCRVRAGSLCRILQPFTDDRIWIVSYAFLSSNESQIEILNR
jgi:hypothetical protein